MRMYPLRVAHLLLLRGRGATAVYAIGIATAIECGANACALAVAHASALRVNARPISAAALLRPVVLDVGPSVAENERPGPVDKMPSREF